MHRGTVLYVHGLWMTGAEGWWLRRQLARQGWQVRNFPWSSMFETLEAAALRCAALVDRLARQSGPVHLIGHSLGGLLVHRVVELGTQEQGPDWNPAGRVVFIASPLQGSRAARWLAGRTAGRLALGRAGRQLAQPQERRWTFGPKAAVIAGTKAAGPGRWFGAVGTGSDGTVAVEETLLEGADLHRTLQVTHHGTLWSPAVVAEIAGFLAAARD